MAGARGDSEQTKAAILEAARELFAERGVKAVRVRDIAHDAGVTHALVHRYFGSKEDIVGEIIRREVATAGARASVGSVPEQVGTMEGLRDILRYGLVEMSTTIRLITRAELSGLEPEKFLEGQGRLLGMLKDWIADQQSKSTKDPKALPDPALAAATIGGSVFAMVSMSPWLMTAVALKPEDYEARIEEVVDVLVGMAAHAAGR